MPKSLRKGIFLTGLAALVSCYATDSKKIFEPNQPSITFSIPKKPRMPIGHSAVRGLIKLLLTTPDNTGNLLHPSVKCNETNCFALVSEHSLRDNQGGTRSDIVENTIGYKSKNTDMLTWTPVNNPIISADEINKATNLSDPELLDLKTKLVSYSRMVDSNMDILYIKESTDTNNWNSLREVLHGPVNSLISPTVLQNGNMYDMLTVDAGEHGCTSSNTRTVRRRSPTYDNFFNSIVDTTDLNENSIPGMVPWHIEMVDGPKDRPDSIIVLVAAHPPGYECGHSNLYMGTTSDKKHIRMNLGALLAAGQDTTFSIVYRSSGRYFPSNRSFIALFSGMRFGGRPESRLAIKEYDYDSMFIQTQQGRAPIPRYVHVVLPRWFKRSEGR